MTSEHSLDEWVTLSIFYVRVPRSDADPTHIRYRSAVLYGEGAVHSNIVTPSISSEKLGDSIRILRVSNEMAVVASMLTQDVFDHNDERFIFGLVARPPIIGLPGPDGMLETPVPHVYRYRQFVRIDKPLLVESLSSDKAFSQSDRDVMNQLLAALARYAGLDLSNKYIRWFGDVIVAQGNKAIVWWEPVLSNDRSYCRAIDVCRESGPVRHMHVQVRVMGLDGMCLYDKLLEWHEGEGQRQRIELLEEIGEVILRVWLNSNLALEEASNVFRSIHTTINVIHNAYAIQARLTQKLERAVRGGAATKHLLTRTQSGQVNAPSIKVASEMQSERWADLASTTQILFDVIRPSAPEYSYFPKGAGGRASAILHFAELISESDQAYLVDPWFDASGAEALIPRIRGEVHLTVITNLPSPQHVETREHLMTFLGSASAVGLPSNLKVLCLVGSRPTKASFHDRYLLLSRNGRWRGFVLTNSFSGLALEYPLFVVESPLGTTALLLDELDRLLDTNGIHVKQMWPPDRAPTTRRLDQGQFPHWRSILRSLVPQRSHAERPWLLSAQARGYIILTEDGLKWHMSPEAREVTLRWLLNAKNPCRRPLISPAKKQRTANYGLTNKSRRRFDIGKSVLFLGELVARGFMVDSHDVATRLAPHHVYIIESALRKSFRDSQDPTILRVGVSRERQGLRQGLAKDIPPARAAQVGLSLWNSNLWYPTTTSSWDRCFGYAVLLYLDPERAVQMCESLLDADFLLCLVGQFHKHFNVWFEKIAFALTGSCSPVLRALGAQALAHSSFSSPNSNDVLAPSNIQSVVLTLETTTLSKEEIAYYLVIWGMAEKVNPTQALVTELARQLGKLNDGELRSVFAFIYQEELHALNLLDRLVNTLERCTEFQTERILKSLVEPFAGRINSLTSEFHFSESVHVHLTIILARAVATLSRLRGTTPTLEIGKLIDFKSLEKRLTPLTPFRWNTNSLSADVALGWSILWLFAAAESPIDDGGCSIPMDVAQRAGMYVATRILGPSGGIRERIKSALKPLEVTDQNLADLGPMDLCCSRVDDGSS